MEVKGKHLVMVFWNLGVGGVQTRMRDVVEKVVKSGGKVTILLDKRIVNEIRITNDRNLKIVSYDGDGPGELKHPFRRAGALIGWGRIRFLWWLIKNFWELEPDVVLAISNRFSAFSIAVKYIFLLVGRKFKLVLNEGIVTSKYLEQYETPIWKKIVALTYPRANLIIVPTKSVADDLVNNFEVDQGKIRIVPSWVKRIEIKEVAKVYDGIFVGRLSVEKGIEFLVDLAIKTKKLNLNYKIAVIGDGDMALWLNQKIADYGLEKYLVNLGYRQQNEVMEYIRKSRLLLLPSRNEGLPMVVLEAYSLGVPTVVTPFLGVKEVVVDKVTGIVTKMNLNDYENKVLDLWGDRKRIKKMGFNAIKYVRENHSRKNLIRFIEAIFESIN